MFIIRNICRTDKKMELSWRCKDLVYLGKGGQLNQELLIRKVELRNCVDLIINLALQ